MIDRKTLSNDWYIRGKQLFTQYEEQDNQRLLFESFIYLWISLTVSCKEYCANNGYSGRISDKNKASDKDDILAWSDRNHKGVMAILNDNIDLVLDLCERKGSESDEVIMDVGSELIVSYHEQFKRYWYGEAKGANPKEIVETFVLILNRVRNNLFHGGKSFRIESDVEILEITTPLLIKLTYLAKTSNG